MNKHRILLYTLVLSIFCITLSASITYCQTYQVSSGMQNDDYFGECAATPDGRYVVYAVTKADYTQVGRLLLVDRTAGTSKRIDLGTGGEEPNAAGTNNPSISADGRYIVFSSKASNLVTNDTNNVRDIFLYDAVNNTTSIVSKSASGVLSNGSSDKAKISANGKFIVFQSSATNLSPTDTNSTNDIYVVNRETGAVEVASVSSTGDTGNGASQEPSISADGNVISFYSSANNLANDELNKTINVIARIRNSGTTLRVSNGINNEQPNSSSLYSCVSANGRYIVFDSVATNLTSDAAGTAGQYDIYIYDIQNQTTKLVSSNADGTRGNKDSVYPVISGDGRYVVFPSLATNFTSTDTNNSYDIYLKDTVTDKIYLVSSSEKTGHIGNAVGSLYNCVTYSSNSKWVTFLASSSQMFNGATEYKSNLMIKNMSTVLGIENLSVSYAQPNTVANNKAATITVVGTGFSSDVSVKLTKTGQPNINGTVNSVASDGKSLEATFNVTNAALGDWNITVSSGSDSATASGALTITEPVSVTSINPDNAVNAGIVYLEITGKGFINGSSVKLQKTSVDDIVSSRVIVSSSTKINAKFDLTNKIGGTWKLTVTSPTGAVSDPVNFEIKWGAKEISPNQVGALPVTLIVNGTGFNTVSQVKLTMQGESDIIGTMKKISTDGTTASINFDLTDKKYGIYDLVFKNSTGGESVIENAVEIGMKIKYVSPAFINLSNPSVITVNGYGFIAPATIKLKMTGEQDITSSTAVVKTPGNDKISTTFSLTGKEAVGKWDIEVINGNGTTDTLPEAVALQKIVSRLITTNGGTGKDVTIKIEGTGFDDSTQVTLKKSGESDITASKVFAFNTGTLLNATFDLYGKKTGTWDIVINVAGLGEVTLPAAFTVESVIREPVEVNIEAPYVWRYTRGSLKIGIIVDNSKSNVDAAGTIVLCGIPKSGVTWKTYFETVSYKAMENIDNSIQVLEDTDQYMLSLPMPKVQAGSTIKYYLYLTVTKDLTMDLKAYYTGF